MSWKKAVRIEEILIGLEAVSRTDTRFAVKASSLLAYYKELGELTHKQKEFAAQIVRQCRATGKSAKVAHYSLYAIDDGVNVKLGYAKSPKTRLRGLQTAQATKLELVWTLPLGTNRTQAAKAERQLHRFCQRHHKRGEWFSRDCMTIVRQFEIRRKTESQHQEEMNELEIVNEARQRI
jgi:hypothetical protein